MSTVFKRVSLSVLGILVSFAVNASPSHAGRTKDPMEKGGEKQCMQQNGCNNMPKGSPQRKQCKMTCKKKVGPGGRQNF